MTGALLAALLTAATALGGTGPWVLGGGDQQVYVGLESQRFDRLAIGSGSYHDDVVTVDGGVSTFGAKLIAAFGLSNRFEIEGELPYQVAFQNQPGAICSALGAGACSTTHGLGVVVVRGKGLVLDEVDGRPVSLSLEGALRFGQLTFEDRHRVTTLGEGTFDVEGKVLVGRSGPLPTGYWSAYLDLGGRYRVPVVRDFQDSGIRVPGWELLSTAEWLFTPGERFSVGPAFGLLWRPRGLDFEEVDLTDPDRFLGLRIFTFEAGAKAIYRSGRNVAASLSVYRTVYAINNPEVWKVNVGIAFRGLVKRRS